MTPTTFGLPLSTKDARWAVEQACLAPSVHNTQPWRFAWNGTAYELLADTARGLTASDPDGRELVISCGAALFNLRLALRKVGYDARVEALPDPSNPRLLARITPSEGSPANPDERRAFAAMTRRHTHRGAFDDQPLSPQVAVAMQRAAELEGAELVFVADPGQRRHVLTLARAAERALAGNPDVQAEISDWTPPSSSLRRDGVPVTAYASEPAHQADDLAPRDFDQGRGYGVGEAVESAPGVVGVLVTETDLQPAWLAAGQALERLLVTASERGAYAALHSQLTEVPHLRGELRHELCIQGYPQVLLRFGYAPDVEHTPRRSVDDVLVLP
jgi:nitroreductase